MNKKRIQQIKCLFTLFFVVCASFYATRSYAQNNAVTIRLSGVSMERVMNEIETVSYTHLRAHETLSDLVCRLLLEKIFFFNDTATTEIYTRLVVGSVRCV